MASEHLNDVKIIEAQEKLYRLQAATLNADETRRIFEKRGLDYQVNADAIRGIGVALNLEESLDRIFNRRAFFPTRFGDGTFPVFYGALKRKTSIDEISFHLQKSLEEGLNFKFLLFSCLFAGTVANLVGKEKTHPELISLDESGYPFCQTFGKKIREKANGIHTVSARRKKEICVPVFVRETISDGRGLRHLVFRLENGKVIYQST